MNSTYIEAHFGGPPLAVSLKLLFPAECTTNCHVYCGFHSATTFLLQPSRNSIFWICWWPLMHFPFIFQPSNKPTRTHSAELLRFNERASLRSGLHIDHRFRRARFVTIDLHIFLNISICPYPPRIFIERVYHKPSISISLLYTVGSCDNFIAYALFIILSHHYIWPKFSSGHYFSLPWSLWPSTR